MAASAFTGLHLHIKVLLWLLTGTYERRLYNPSTNSIKLLESPYLIRKKPVSKPKFRTTVKPFLLQSNSG